MGDDERLVARDLIKRFSPDSQPAVDGISLSVSKGEVLSIVGSNGAGKSTLIQMLLGILVPDSGSIRLFGVDMTRHRRKIAHRINYASTDLSLPYSLTVRENLDVFALVYNLPHPGKAVDRILETFSLGHLSRVRVGRLSTGQIARLGIAKALLSDPDILFLDEPTATLDPEAAQEIRMLLQGHVRNSGLGLVYTSHNMREVERLSDRIMIIESGKMIAEGTADELCQAFFSPDLESAFLRSMLESRQNREENGKDTESG
ncbi:MAG: ABC transporter ATP-binding protein [Leptospirales bacterium]